MFLGGFLHFLYQWKQRTYNIFSFIVTANFEIDCRSILLLNSKNEYELIELFCVKNVCLLLTHGVVRRCH